MLEEKPQKSTLVSCSKCFLKTEGNSFKKPNTKLSESFTLLSYFKTHENFSFYTRDCL